MGAPFEARELSCAGPFDLANTAAYSAWRHWKLAHAPRSAADLLVEVAHPGRLTPSERDALLLRVARCGMALYASPRTDENPDLPRQLGEQLGLCRLDANWLAEEDGISRIEVASAGAGPEAEAAPSRSDRGEGRGGFIPYTNRAIRWHTDGYYHPAQRRIRGMVLHAVRPAARGGENALLDHELAYLLLRDQSPEHIAALMQPDAMTIPARLDESGVARPAQSGPVFSVDPVDGRLHMRYTARTRSIEWKADDATRAAVASLEGLLADPATVGCVRATLAPGMGLVCQNVLHDRSGFDDDPAQPRLLYRARYLDRVACAPWPAAAADIPG